MQLRAILFLILIQTTSSLAQIATFHYAENFDGVTAPILPSGWSGNGFLTYASSPRSTPNCISATGNRSIKTLLSPAFNFGSRLPDKLVFWERRTSTAAAYRIEIRASVDGVNFGILLARFDTITTVASYIQRTIDLSNSGLNFQSNVQFKWIVLADSTNNTGVLRIDDVSLSVTTGLDVGFSKIIVAPVNATRKDSIILSTTVKNYGSLVSSNFSIRFFCDENSNSLYEPIDQFSVLNGLSLNTSDSLTCLVTHAPMKAGVHSFVAIIDFSSDENHTNDTARTIINVGNVKCDVLVNEIMYCPASDEPEWVELKNTSSDTINLKNWRISDSNISTKSIITQTDALIPPSSYLVIAKDIVFASYHSGVPVVIAYFSALNNSTPDAVVIYDPSLCTIDSVAYLPSWGGQNGKSLERIDVQASSTESSNWTTSQDTLGSTPGRTNSIARMDYDMCIKSLRQIQTVVNGETVSGIDVVVGNVGRKQADSVIVHFYSDNNRNGKPEAFELTATIISSESLAAGDSILLHESPSQFPPGETNMIVILDYWKDERKWNNQAAIPVRISYKVSSIVINEIMAAPLIGECEWLELYNCGSIPVDISHWTFHDLPTASGSVNQFFITIQPTVIKSHDFVVVAADSSVMHLLPPYSRSVSSIYVILLNRSGGLGFNNDADVVVLQDLTGKTIDSVEYHIATSGQNGKSLERIDVDAPSTSMTNWGTSQDSLGSTPGRKNSIARLECDLMISNLTQKQTMVGGKVVPVVNVSVYNIGRRTVDSILISFYSDKNCNAIPEPLELMHTAIYAQSLAACDSILLSESFPQLASGATNIIVIADWWRDENLRNNRASVSVKTNYESRSLVINEIMYDPLNGQNEWFELFNRSGQPVDLAHWTFNDRPTLNNVNSFEISSQPFAIKSGEYAIVAADSSIFTLFQSLSQSDSTIHICVLNRSGGFSFNNDGDVVVLKDLTGKTIDSVAYLPSWHHPDVVDTKGRSLERINPNIDSNDPRNWSTCTNILGGTPGKANSIVAVSIKSNSMISISPNPFSPDGDGFEDFCIIRYNFPIMTSTLNLRIYDIKGRLIRTLANGELAGTQGEIVWDGIDDNKQRVRIGVYVIFLEATDRSSGKVMTAKAVVVVATKL